MKARNIVLIALVCLVVLIPLAMVFTHLNFSFHRRSWEKSRLEAQRDAAHGSFSQSVRMYESALQDAEQFPISPLMLATTYREAADSCANSTGDPKLYAQAPQYYERCRALIDKSALLDDKDWLSLKFACLSGLGRLLYDRGDYQTAESVLNSALPVYAKMLAVNKRVPDDLIAGDELIHDTVCLGSICSIRADDNKAASYVVEADKLLLKFPIDTSSRAVLLRLAEKYKIPPPEQVEMRGL